VRPCVHFVGFKSNEYVSARRVWGVPDFIHRGWDTRAWREIAPEDTVVFARGEWTQPPSEKQFSDTLECDRLERLSVEHWAAVAEQYAVAGEGR
jgi:hypothetical protein